MRLAKALTRNKATAVHEAFKGGNHSATDSLATAVACTPGQWQRPLFATIGRGYPATLIARCRERGVSRLIAEVMRCNSHMLCLAKKYGFRCESVHDNTCHIVLDLDTQPA